MKMSGKIYLVYGWHGKYSDYSEWNVAAFTSQDKANLFRDLVQRKYQESRARFKKEEERAFENVNNPFPEPSAYVPEEDLDAPIGSSYEATYTVTAVKFNPQF